jgi:hypothetical protein
LIRPSLGEPNAKEMENVVISSLDIYVSLNELLPLFHQ